MYFFQYMVISDQEKVNDQKLALKSQVRLILSSNSLCNNDISSYIFKQQMKEKPHYCF